jgi:hypothetical protein
MLTRPADNGGVHANIRAPGARTGSQRGAGREFPFFSGPNSDHSLRSFAVPRDVQPACCSGSRRLPRGPRALGLSSTARQARFRGPQFFVSPFVFVRYSWSLDRPRAFLLDPLQNKYCSTTLFVASALASLVALLAMEDTLLRTSVFDML